jgi:hypothetical protein
MASASTAVGRGAGYGTAVIDMCAIEATTLVPLSGSQRVNEISVAP